jgi:hypothetical protein
MRRHSIHPGVTEGWGVWWRWGVKGASHTRLTEHHLPGNQLEEEHCVPWIST